MPFPTTAISQADGTSALASFGGSVKAFATVSAQTGTGAGLVADFGSAVNNVAMVLTGTSTSTQVDLEGSVDNANWIKLKTDTAGTVVTARLVSSSLIPVRYVRGNVISIANGNVTAQFMACD